MNSRCVYSQPLSLAEFSENWIQNVLNEIFLASLNELYELYINRKKFPPFSEILLLLKPLSTYRVSEIFLIKQFQTRIIVFHMFHIVLLK